MNNGTDFHAQTAMQVDRVVQHLNWLKEEGTTMLDVQPETLTALGHIGKGQPKMTTAPTQNPNKISTSPPLDAIAARIAVCKRCGLCETRTNTVPGQGNPKPEILFIGEGPGADEDAQGLAFVGRAGQLLTKMIQAMGLERDDVWIGNIVKCRPPNNRAPTPEEMEACLPYLREQIALLKPKVMVCLGATAVKGLFNPTEGITKLRGKWLTFENMHVMPTFHPAYLLRNPPAKRYVWEDLKEVLRFLGRPLPEK